MKQQDTSEQITVNYRSESKQVKTSQYMVKGYDQHDFEQNIIALVDRLYPRNVSIVIQSNNEVWVM